MSALWKTLAGDSRNLAVVAVLAALAAILARSGYGREAAFLIPPLELAGIAWLAAR